MLVSYWSADAEATGAFVEHLFSASHQVAATSRSHSTCDDRHSRRRERPLREASLTWSAFVLVGDGHAPLFTNEMHSG